MYNENQKNEYLKLCKYEIPTVETIRVFFHSSEPVEVQEGVDLSEFNRPQIVRMLKKFNSTSTAVLKGACVYFSDYYEWCKVKGYVDQDSQNQYAKNLIKLVVEDIIPKDILNNKYFTHQKMLGYLDNIYAPENKYTAYAIYCGIKGDDYEELANIKKSDLNSEINSLELITGRTMMVDDLFVSLMNQADASTGYYEDQDKKAEDAKVYGYLPTGYVLKQMIRGKLEPFTPNTLKVRLRTIRDQSENSFLSVSALYKNGLINYIKTKYEKQGISLEKAILEGKNTKLYTYDLETEKYIKEFGSKTTARMLRLEIKDYLDCFK